VVINRYWLFIILFIIIDLVFNTVRVSLMYTRITNLLSLRNKYPEEVDSTLNLLENQRLPAMLRISTVTIHFILAGLIMWALLESTAMQADSLRVILLFLGILLITILVEFFTQRFILKKPDLLAVRLTPVAQLMDYIFFPFSWLFTKILGSPAILRHGAGSVTEDEIKNWVETDQPEGGLEMGERKMIYSIFQFSDTLAREVMVPRIDVSAIDVDMSLPEALSMVVNSGHSRLPVYEETIDNVIGVLYAKDLLQLQLKKDNDASIRNRLRKAYFVPEAKKVDELLGEMQARGVHLAVVVDEYGGMAGLVTLEDIVEEIVGEIRDEYDDKEELLYQEVGTDEYLFHGRIDLDDFNEIVGTHMTKDVADTLGGIIYGEVGRVPVGGEEILIEGWVLTVEQVSGRRIRSVRVKKALTLPDDEAGSADTAQS